MSPSAEEIPAWAVRIEAKLDVAIARQDGRLDNHAEKIASAERDAAAFDERLRVVENRRGVTFPQLGATVLGIFSVIAGMTPFLDRLYS